MDIKLICVAWDISYMRFINTCTKSSISIYSCICMDDSNMKTIMTPFYLQFGCLYPSWKHIFEAVIWLNVYDVQSADHLPSEQYSTLPSLVILPPTNFTFPVVQISAWCDYFEIIIIYIISVFCLIFAFSLWYYYYNYAIYWLF